MRKCEQKRVNEKKIKRKRGLYTIRLLTRFFGNGTVNSRRLKQARVATHA
jgi:hypothetical protein